MCLLWQIQALQGPGVPDDYYEVICKFNEQLLGSSASNSVLVENLIKRLRDNSLEAKADSKIVDVVNSRGQLANRHSLLHAEKGELIKVASIPYQALTSMLCVQRYGAALHNTYSSKI